ncbi:metallophosphoesterase [Conexibacter woesei]|uniref:metallophosphoesterase n=1 Tax=Conexibacter woesei TaxID=191495 RepID=UPI0004201CBC|nr:metallophosphoesterase [Conexibacter woesei]
MRTLVISDLHLGGRTGVDVLVRDPDALRALTRALRDVDRLVLLGDTLELRHGPAREALAAAQPVLETIGDALAPDASVALVPGNHDYALAAPWLDARTTPLGLGATAAPAATSPLAERVAGWLNRDTEVAYPGLWLRDDVWATHGHYLDPHGTVPTFERLAAGVMGRMVGQVPEPTATAEDYERILAPLYAWIHASAQRAHDGRVGAGAGRAGKAYTLLSGDGHQPLKARLLGAAFPLGIRGVNLLKLGPVSSDLSGDALRRNALDAMTAVLQRLQVDTRHVIFGHSHRTGPLPADDAGEWRTPSGTKLYNSGSWVHEPSFTGAAGSASPYWPGGAVLVTDEGPPELLRLLG